MSHPEKNPQTSIGELSKGSEQMVAPSTSQRERYAELLRSPHLLSRILEIAEDAIISIDETQRIVMFNEGAERIFGYATREILGKPLNVLLPEESARDHEQHVREFAESPPSARHMGERGQIWGRRKDGEVFPAEASISKVELEGVRIFSVILRDMSDHVAAEEKLRVALREKEILLREVHHRVKNNLQVVSSLLNLQSRSIADEATRQKFKESQNRVQSMALIHEQLYQSRSLAELDFPEYVRQLTASLFGSYRVSASRIDLETRFDKEVQLGVDAAVPCGLIINELVANALKHAFPNGRGGKIRIELSRVENDRAALCVCDNGIGLPPHVGLQNSETLGLRLVRSLVAQLGGEADVRRSAGTAVRITFPAKETED